MNYGNIESFNHLDKFKKKLENAKHINIEKPH